MLTEATTPPVYVRPRISERTVLLVASFGAFLAFLDATIVNVAFPNIRESFPEAGVSELSWILNAYSIVFAAFLVVSGRLADLLGRRRAFTAGVALFTVASVLCAVAPSVGVLILFRIVQALGAAILVPASLALVVEAFPPDRRSHAIGLWGASAALASGLGPPIGGALVELGDWRWAFMVNLPFGLAALWAGRRLLVESRAPGRRRMPDLAGASLSARDARRCSRSASSRARTGAGRARPSWPASRPRQCSSRPSSSARAGTDRRSLDPALLRIRPFAVGNAATIVAGMGFYAYLLTNILWLQYVWGYSVLASGLAVVPGALVAAVLAAVLGPIAQKRGYRLIIVPGAIIWALAYVWYLTRVEVTPDFLGAWLPGQIISGIGVGATLPVLGSAALAAVPGGRFATASAVNSSARQIGAVLGIAILVVIVGTPIPRPSSTVCVPAGSSPRSASSPRRSIAVFLGRVSDTVLEPVDDDSVRPPAVSAPQPSVPVVSSSSALAAAPLLARLPDDVRARLEHRSEPVAVAAGELLFAAGDEAGDMYVVTAGLLDVEVAGETVRQVGAGAVLGELALLTGGRRSASIRARRDSHLLRVSHETFEDVVGSDAGALRALTGVLATQLQEASPPPSTTSPQPRVVAVVALHAGAPAAAVGAGLAEHLGRFLTVAQPGRVGPDGLERAERGRRPRAPRRRRSLGRLVERVRAPGRPARRGRRIRHRTRSGRTSRPERCRPRPRRSRRALGAGACVLLGAGTVADHAGDRRSRHRRACARGTYRGSVGRSRAGRWRRSRLRAPGAAGGAGGRRHRGRPGRGREPGVDHGGAPRARLRCPHRNRDVLRGVRPAEPLQRLHGAEHLAGAWTAYREGAAPAPHRDPHRGAASAVPVREHGPAEPGLRTSIATATSRAP